MRVLVAAPVGYPIDLANPVRIEQYSGLKHADKDDAYHLAEVAAAQDSAQGSSDVAFNWEESQALKFESLEPGQARFLFK